MSEEISKAEWSGSRGKEQLACPKCGRYKIISDLEIAWNIGLVGLIFGTLILWAPLVGLLMVIIGFFVTIAAIFMSMIPIYRKRMHCQTCKYKWVIQ